MKTNIGWTDYTFNIAWGCDKISAGCKFCYALALAIRYGWDIWGPDKPRRVFGEKHWAEPLKWNSQVCAFCGKPATCFGQYDSAKEGYACDECCGHGNEDGHCSPVRRSRVFCSSMCDIFEDHPTIIAELKKLWPLIRATPNLDWQLLTKRADRIQMSLPEDWGTGYPNVWLGVSVENQKEADARIPHLLQIPTKVRFLSVEPLLESVDLYESGAIYKGGSVAGNEYVEDGLVDWVIVGGESGPGRRDCGVAAIEHVASQCVAASVPVFVKQASHAKPGQRGQISDAVWALKQFPRVE